VLRAETRTEDSVVSSSTLSRRTLPSITLLALTLFTLSCFEQPVTESMEIRFLPGAAALVRVTVRLTNPDQFEDSPPARERIEQTRRDILEARDPWTLRLMSLEPVSERTTWDREAGSLVRADHRVLLEDAQTLKRFFSDTLLRATITPREKETEFTLTPGPGSRASRQQQEALKREMEKWTSAVARYLEAGERLYAYLGQRPDRAEACFASVFKETLSDEAKEKYEQPSAEDNAVLEPFNKAMEEVLNLFAVPSDSAFSPEELSRLVYDPFPASLVVRVPGPVLEVEGFQDGGSEILRAPALSLWDAFTRIQDRWLTPNPVVIYYEHLAGGKKPLDLEDFLGCPRSARRAPSPGQVLHELEEGLKPAAVYRVRWSTENLPELEDSGYLWDHPALQ
jgi:hypothetical protein